MWVIEPDKLLIMLVLDVLDDELGGAECFVADLAHILATLNHLTSLVLAVLVLKLNKKLIFLRVTCLLVRSLLEILLGCLDVVLLELEGRAVQGGGFEDDTVD